MDDRVNNYTFDEKKEMVFECYKVTFDKEVSYTKVSLTKDEIEILNKDTEFQSRLAYALAQQKEKVIKRLTELMTYADKDEVTLKATIKLGEIIYAEAFKETSEQGKTELILPETTQKKLEEIFTSGNLEAWKKQMREKLLSNDTEQDKDINEILN